MGLLSTAKYNEYNGSSCLVRWHVAIYLSNTINTLTGFGQSTPFGSSTRLRRDPRRGREQADRIREEVIGF